MSREQLLEKLAELVAVAAGDPEAGTHSQMMTCSCSSRTTRSPRPTSQNHEVIRMTFIQALRLILIAGVIAFAVYGCVISARGVQ